MTLVDEGQVPPVWVGCFPFVSDFGQVVDGQVSVELIERLVCVLEPAVQLFSDTVEQGNLGADTVRLVFYCVNALARCRVALAYAPELSNERVSRPSLLAAMEKDWLSMVYRECLVEVDYARVVGTVLGDSIGDVWTTVAVGELSTARSLWGRFAPVMAGVCAVAVAQVLVVCDRGLPLVDLLEVHGDKPVLPFSVYQELMARVKLVGLRGEEIVEADVLFDGLDAAFSVGALNLGSEVVRQWMWILLASYTRINGFCYQFVYAPVARYRACVALQYNPRVSQVVRHLETTDVHWSAVLAQVDYGPVVHVVAPGRPDLGELSGCLEKYIGMQSVDKSAIGVDYYARALVDEFIDKHSAAVPTALPPLDAALDSLSISTSAGVKREFVEVATMLYSSVDESVSPRAEVGRLSGSRGAPDDGALVEHDSAVVRDVFNRLTDGAVIREGYFERTYRRYKHFRRRPRLAVSDGRLYHVFEGFPADGGSGTGPWELDEQWTIPGWCSYVAEFDNGEDRTVAFVADGGCQDVRMDCSGAGMLEFGECKVRVDGTLLWFTNSVRFRVVAGKGVSLRISVPMAGSAVAMGAEMRRYMHIPGYTVVARSYDVITGDVSLVVPMKRTRPGSVAGCHVFSGQRYVERGRHRFKLGRVVSMAPAKLLFKTEPPEALEFVSVCGMRLYPRARDYVAALVDLRNVEMQVSMSGGGTLVASMVQIVHLKEYEMAVASFGDARMVSCGSGRG